MNIMCLQETSLTTFNELLFSLYYTASLLVVEGDNYNN